MMSMTVGLEARVRKADRSSSISSGSNSNEAHEIGFLAGQKEQYGGLTPPGSPDRPAWMDIRLDDPEGLARNNIRFQPVVMRSLLGAGYRRLGELRWVPSRELMNMHYVGFKWAGKIRAVIRRFESGAPVVTP